MELPRLEGIWKKYRDSGLAIVSVECGQDHEQGRSFIRDNNLTFHILEDDEDGTVSGGLYLSEGVPTTYVIDGAGKVISYHLGFSEGDEAVLEKEIVELLEN